jgi:hypothetical protein
MLRRLRIVAAAIAAFALLGAAAPASAGSAMDDIDPNSVPASVDLILLRPIGLVTTAVGAVAFVPAAAVTALFHRQSIPAVFDILVRGPYEFTFVDPIGAHGDSKSTY